MTLKTLFKCDFNVKTKSHLPISKKGWLKFHYPRKKKLNWKLNSTKKYVCSPNSNVSLPAPFFKTRQTRALFTSWRHDGQTPRASRAASLSLPSANLLIRKILVVTSVYARTDSGRGGGRSQGNPTGSGECHLFLPGNRAVLLGNRRFSWREIAWPSSLLKKRFL